ncbi:SDR family NAD(P)-dependent oxidoreductase [Falsiroseomonas sp. HW251]|uniref:SDR family NAD(P)-dependent oxidoreductase n=1 Tax=Falsiroseomonas sp. HW251 TaxID=3390998 RepID=UPI003D3108AF
MTTLAGKVAVVTGAGRGIGAAIAKALAAAGATVACASRSVAEVEATAQRVRDAGGRAIARRCDVGDASDVAALYEAVAAQEGGFDLLFANAGVSLDQRPVGASDPAAFEETFRVNLFGVYHCARLAIPHMRARGGGRMVVTGSGMGHSSLHGHAAYSASKAGVWMLVRILADELRADGITVNELVPGPVRTAMTGVPQREGSVVNNPIEWLKQPEDVVPLAMFLATHPGPGPTGQSFSLMRRTF